MKILFLAPRFPLPADTGAKIRTYNLLKQAAKGNKVTLLSFSFDYDADLKESEMLKRSGIDVNLVKSSERINPFMFFGRRPVSIAKYNSPEMARRLKEIIAENSFDLIHFDHLHMGQYRKYVNGMPCVLDEHNVESMILERLANIGKSTLKNMIYKSQAGKMKNLESGIVGQFSQCLAVSEDDRKALLRLSDSKAHVRVVPNGVDTGYFRSADTETMEEALVFTGSMDWLPNSDAAAYFCREILPLVWRYDTSVKFYIVGKNPTQDIKELASCDKRIVVTGTVDDVRPYILRSKVFVAPLRIGGGTRLKILEAMAMEKGVVSTTLGAEGIDYTDGRDIILADSPQDFADSVVSLLKDSKKAAELGRNGRRLVCKKYDWNIIGEQLLSAYREGLDGRQQ